MRNRIHYPEHVPNLASFHWLERINSFSMGNIKEKRGKIFQGYQMCTEVFRSTNGSLSFVINVCLGLCWVKQYSGQWTNILDNLCSTGVLHIEFFHV